MKAKELRIGNWINYKGNPCRFDIGDYYEANHNDEFLELLVKPIPLTEEWLLKFGFEKIVMNNMIDIIHYQNKDCWIYLIKDVFELELIVEDERLNLYRNWKYVHQLQNLYFALTGEEL